MLFSGAALIGLTSINFRSPRARLLPLLGAGTLIVGFAEELLCRGLLIVGPRDGGWTEVAVFLVSTALFALLHGVNMFFGQSARTTVVQIAVAFLIPGGWIDVDDTLLAKGFDWLYAVGDVNHRALLTHQGKYQARAAAMSSRLGRTDRSSQMRGGARMSPPPTTRSFRR